MNFFGMLHKQNFVSTEGFWEVSLLQIYPGKGLGNKGFVILNALFCHYFGRVEFRLWFWSGFSGFFENEIINDLCFCFC